MFHVRRWIVILGSGTGSDPRGCRRWGSIVVMRLPWRSRYHDVIERQLAMFADDNRPLLVRISDAKRRYERARGADSEEAYGDYIELVEEAEDELLALRDRYASTMEGRERSRYQREFTRAAERRLPTLQARRMYERAMDPDDD